MEELENKIRELLQANEERRRAEQNVRKWKRIFWSLILLSVLPVFARAQSGDYLTTASQGTAGNPAYWAVGISAGLLTLAGLAARARMKRIEEAEARENSCGEYGCIDGGVPFQFAQQQQQQGTTYIIQQQPFQQQPQRQVIYVQAPAQQQFHPQTEVVYLQGPPVQQQRQPAQREVIYLTAPQQQYGYLPEAPQREVRYLPEGTSYQRQAPQEVYYDSRAYQPQQPVRYMPQETYQPDPRGAHHQAPQSYYAGPGADPYVVEYVEEYPPAKYISRGQQPIGQLPAPNAITIDEARRRFEKERDEMKRRR